jgi:L-rhamnose mutarotase
MVRVCFLAHIRPDLLDKYREQAWPETLTALREAAWGNNTLLLAEDGLLIRYPETGDYQAALDRMARTDVNKQWQVEMVPSSPMTAAGLARPRVGGSSGSPRSSTWSDRPDTKLNVKWR